MIKRLFVLCTALFLAGSGGLRADSQSEQYGFKASAVSKKGDNSPKSEKKSEKESKKSGADDSDADGFYVVMGNYFPKLPADLPEDTNPAVWLKQQNLDDIQWERSPQPVYFFIPEKWAKSADVEEDEWTVGRSVTMPITFSFTPPPQDGEESKPIETDGALLLKVEATYPDADALTTAYPAIKEAGVNDSVIKLDDKGTFSFEYAEEGQGEIELSSQPMELAKKGEEWSKADQQTAIDMYFFFHENFGCFVATAIYRAPSAPQLTSLRAFRDKILLTSESGRLLMRYYYKNGPHWAWRVYQKPYLTTMIKPFVATAAFVTGHLDLDRPFTQKVLHKVVDVVAWCLKPWISEQESSDRVDQPGSGERLVPVLAPQRS